MFEGIDRDSQLPLHKQVRLYLDDLIARAGTSLMLPPETEIGKRLGISRATVRLAIMDLVRERAARAGPREGHVHPPRLHTAGILQLAERREDLSAHAVCHDRAVPREANRGIDIENLGIQYEHTEHQLMLMTSAGRAPDLAALIYLWIPIFAHQGALLPLESLYTPEIRRRLYPQSAAAVNFRGQPYAFTLGQFASHPLRESPPHIGLPAYRQARRRELRRAGGVAGPSA